MDLLFLIGLGNPGTRYQGTRHNVGFWTVDRVARELGIRWNRRSFSACWGEGAYAGKRVVLVKPLAYMNRSGFPVAEILKTYRSGPEALWVVHDDLDLPVGRIRIRRSGGTGGHRGVASILAALGTKEFGRIRIGIGRPPEDQDAAAYVLAEPDDEERTLLLRAVGTAVEAALCIARHGPEEAMQRYNSRTESSGPERRGRESGWAST